MKIPLNFISLVSLVLIFALPVNAQPQTLSNFEVIAEVFYQDLAKLNLTKIAPFILFPQSRNIDGLDIFGEALSRSPEGPIGITSLPLMANKKVIAPTFKAMTGFELLDYKLVVVRYLSFNKIKLLNMSEYEQAALFNNNEYSYCDLWLFGSDQKWRVACDYAPHYDLNVQSLGLYFSKPSEEILKIQERLYNNRKKTYPEPNQTNR